MKKLSLFYVLLFLSSFALSQNTIISPQITSEELKAHLKYLASDELEGRKPGTKGNELAAKYISEQFSTFGLKPLGDNKTYFQNFPFISELKIGKNNSLTIRIGDKTTQFKPNIDFNPLNYSDDTTVTGGLVFAGYGIVADSLQYNDYDGIDVKGKIVMILRYSPDGDSSTSPFFEYSSFQKKIMVARDKGASGIIFVTGPLNTDNNKLIPLRLERGMMNSGLPIIHLKSEVAENILNAIGKNLYEIQKSINENKKPNSFELANIEIKLQTQIERIYSNTNNVVGYIEGNDPILKNNYIVIGAHFDHLGYGGSGSLVPDTVAIHNGADDNASGTVGLLELAQYIASKKEKIKRSYIFVAFSAEEMGLLGSSHFVKNPPIEISKIDAMINMDMIGRLRDSTLTIQGVGTSPIWNEVITRQNSDSVFKLKLGQDGFGSSDHASFNSKDIPVLFFFTGLHSEYHKPTDDWELINYEGEKLVLDFISNLIFDIDTIPKKFEYTRVASSGNQREGMRGFRVTFGILPDFGDEAKGLRISGTRPGSPAEKAGLKPNDIIVKFGGKSVRNIYDFTSLLGDFKPGDEVEVEVIRGDQTLTLKAVLKGR